jgi:D-lactate dehydrogenase (cytochrome)
MEKRAFLAQKPAIQDAVYGAAVALGGTFSAEHGIGRIKIDELARYRPQIDLELMTRLKQVIDPNGIMNPGKVIRPLIAAQ